MDHPGSNLYPTVPSSLVMVPSRLELPWTRPSKVNRPDSPDCARALVAIKSTAATRRRGTTAIQHLGYQSADFTVSYSISMGNSQSSSIYLERLSQYRVILTHPP